jgi:hypothetical protein
MTEAGTPTNCGTTSCSAIGECESYFLLGITMITINVMMLKNNPSSPQPSGLRPFVPAMTAQMIAARMLPIETKTNFIEPPMMPAATRLSCKAKTVSLIMSPGY